MKRRMTWMMSALLGLALSGPAWAHGNEKTHKHESVSMSDLPQAVRTTFDREAKGGKLEELRKETRKDGATVYEAEIVSSGKGQDITVASDGKVLERGKMHDESQEKEHRSTHETK